MAWKVEHDGCEGCKYEFNYHEYDEPCNRCKQNYYDLWEERKDDENMGKKYIDQEVFINKLWQLIKDENNKDMQGGLLQAVLVAQLMDTAETVERGDVE